MEHSVSGTTFLTTGEKIRREFSEFSILAITKKMPSERNIDKKVVSNSRFVPYSFLNEIPQNGSVRIRKLVSKTIVEKYKILKEIDDGSSCVSVRRKYDVPKQTLSNWRRNRKQIYDAVESDDAFIEKKQRVRVSPFRKINEACYVWFEEARRENIHVTATLVKTKALSFVTEFQIENFQASDGWLARWKKRRNISFDIAKSTGWYIIKIVSLLF